MNTVKLEVFTPNGEIFNDEVISVVLPGEEGEFGVLPSHASLSTLLTAGIVDIEKIDKSIESIIVDWGVVQVLEDKIVVLVEGAVAIRGYDESSIAKSLDNAKELIKSIGDSNPATIVMSARLESAAQRLI